MLRKKVSVFIMSLLCLSLFPLAAADAAANYTMYFGGYNSSIGGYRTPNVHSSYNRVQICSNVPKSNVTFELWESDPGGYGEHDKIGTFTLSWLGCKTFTNISGFRDGTDKEAELYVRTKTNPGSGASMNFYVY